MSSYMYRSVSVIDLDEMIGDQGSDCLPVLGVVDQKSRPFSIVGGSTEMRDQNMLSFVGFESGN